MESLVIRVGVIVVIAIDVIVIWFTTLELLRETELLVLLTVELEELSDVCVLELLESLEVLELLELELLLEVLELELVVELLELVLELVSELLEAMYSVDVVASLLESTDDVEL